MRLRRPLHAEARRRIPAGIEQHKDDSDLVSFRDVEELLHALHEAVGVLLPKHMVQVYPQRIEADRSGPAQLAIDRHRIERLGLPHLELIDRRTREKVAPDQPSVVALPRFGLLFGPASGGVLTPGNKRMNAQQHNDPEDCMASNCHSSWPPV